MKRFTYCPHCKGDLDQQTITTYQCTACNRYLWDNPKATVAVALTRNNQVLVAQRGIEPNKGKYDLPGGFIEYGEVPFEAAKRELREEAGIEINDLSLLTAYGGLYGETEPVCDLIILARQWTGEPRAKDDVAGFSWQPYGFLDSEQFAPQFYKGLRQLLESINQ